MKTQEIAIVSLEESWSAWKESELTFKNGGFTMVELIIVVAIITILASLAVPSFSHVSNLAKVARAKSEIRTIDKAVNAFLIDNNRLPAGQATFSEIGPEGSFIDPWGTPYQYSKIGTYRDELGAIINQDDYDLYSKGADRNSAGTLTDPNCQDDIIRAGGGSIIELGSEYM